MQRVALVVAIALAVVLHPGIVGARKPRTPKPVAVANLLHPARASDLVAVQASTDVGTPCTAGGSQGRAFDRLMTPPTVTNLQIPSGRVLVITRLEWNLFQGTKPSQSRAVLLYRAVGGAVNGPAAQSRALADSLGRAGGSETFPTGLVFRPEEQLCLVIEDGGPFDKVGATVHGFFAADE